MSGISKFISAIVVLLLLIGLAFGIYSFVDSSKKGNERLSDKTTQQEKKKDDKDKKEKKDKKSVEEKKNNTQQTQQTVQTPQRPTTQTPVRQNPQTGEKRAKEPKTDERKKLDKTVQILKKAQMKKINRQHNKSHNKINLTSHQRIVKVPKINQIKHSQPDHKTMEIVAIKMLVRGRTHKNKIITIKILKAQKRINKK